LCKRKLSRSKPTHPWITTEVRRIINKKNKAGNKASKTKSQRDKDRYRKLKSLTQRTTRKAYNDYVTNIISPEQTNNPKRFCVPKNIIFLSKVNPDSTNVYGDTNDMCDNNDQEMILSQPPREPDTMLNKDEYTTV
jgi:hypothetical protein